MRRVFGDLLRIRGPAGAVVVAIPSLVWGAIMLLLLWFPGGSWVAAHARMISGTQARPHFAHHDEPLWQT
jgi:hypothetical protein